MKKSRTVALPTAVASPRHLPLVAHSDTRFLSRTSGELCLAYRGLRGRGEEGAEPLCYVACEVADVSAVDLYCDRIGIIGIVWLTFERSSNVPAAHLESGSKHVLPM
jgi:hypothetical protein